jgi:hypothetical protein
MASVLAEATLVAVLVLLGVPLELGVVRLAAVMLD